MTKIFFIINNLSLGGAEKMLLDLILGLPKDKYQIAVATVTGGGPLEEDYRNAGIELFINHKKTKLGFDVLKTLKKQIKDFKPDIVHTHLWSADFWGRWAALRSGVKLIISTEHNRNVEEGPIKKSIKHFLSYFTSVIVASSASIKDYQVKKELIASKKIRVIPYGINLEKFPFRGTKTVHLQDGPLKILNIGRLTHQKGQQYLIEAIAKLKEDRQNIFCEIVGDGELKAKLQDVAKRVHVENEVKFVGAIKEVAKSLNDADLFVLPSLYEGLGIVLLEAMSVGVPVIASDIPGVNEVVRDDETGILFEKENSDDLADKIVQLFSNPALQEKIITSARRLVEEKYSHKKMVNNYDMLYQYLIGHQKAFAIQYGYTGNK